MIKLYYNLKPYISRKMQLNLRRFILRFQLLKYRNVWPIDKKALWKPEWFTGWPEQKKIALLVTHDVEQKPGMDKIKQLAEVDKKYGIVSSFGLVPKRYAVTPEVLDYLKKEKREVYIHDLYHDGKLFSDYTHFHKLAPEINRYIREWNVSGFRAGAMHRNLDWIGELDIKYDMSTFDTDPFEPMPDGVCTLYPFATTSPSTSRCYIEIPYTLPQDLTVLVLHPKPSISIWKKKLDWIAEAGGMVSVNVHPDYIAFNKNERSYDNYPVEMYEEFLAYLTDRYAGLLWNPSPSEMSVFISNATKERLLKF